MSRNLSELIIYTSTFYGENGVSRVRQELCLNMLKNASDLGIKVVLKDGGSNGEFINKVKNFNNVFLIEAREGEKKKSMGADRREALEEAVNLAARENMETPLFFWMEPEKDALISEDNLEKMATEIRRGSNIVVPARKEEAWETLPENQRWFEQRANKRALGLANDFSGGRHEQLLDLWFGPKMFDQEGVKFFREYNKDNARTDLWDAIIVPVTEAIKEGKSVASVAVDYKYSASQKISETGEQKDAFTLIRLEQYAQILKEMGDPLWQDFFNEAEESLAEIKKLQKEKNLNAESQELLGEQKKNVLKAFFKIK